MKETIHNNNGEVIAQAFDGQRIEYDADRKPVVVDLTPEEHAAEKEATKLGELRGTDAGMARVAEDALVAIITGRPPPQEAVDAINKRRSLRGEPDISLA